MAFSNWVRKKLSDRSIDDCVSVVQRTFKGIDQWHLRSSEQHSSQHRYIWLRHEVKWQATVAILIDKFIRAHVKRSTMKYRKQNIFRKKKTISKNPHYISYSRAPCKGAREYYWAPGKAPRAEFLYLTIRLYEPMWKGLEILLLVLPSPLAVARRRRWRYSRRSRRHCLGYTITPNSVINIPPKKKQKILFYISNI